MDIDKNVKEHNHSLDHVPKKIFTPEEENILLKQRMWGLKPRDQLLNVLDGEPFSGMCRKDIYNINAKNKKRILDGRSPLEALIDVAGQMGYLHKVNFDSSSGRVTHAIFCHPEATSIALRWPQVLVMDCTYKTNKFNRPLFHIVCKTPFNTVLTCAYVIMNDECKEDYQWALENLKSLYGPDFKPNVVVTDCDRALINAIQEVHVPHHLCRWHMNMNVKAYIKFHLKVPKVEQLKIYGKWNDLCDIEDEAKFNYELERFEAEYGSDHGIISYLKKTWLDPWKERFVSCWVNNNLHFGTTTSSPVEAGHSALKRFLDSSNGDLLECFQVFHKAIVELEKQQQRIVRLCHQPVYSLVMKKVSKFALLKTLGCSSELILTCKGVFLRTMGLPCFHLITHLKAKNKQLILDHFHPHWWIVLPPPTIPLRHPYDLTTPLLGVLERYQNAPPHDQAKIPMELNDINNNGSTIILGDPTIGSRKGRPPKKKKIAQKGNLRDLRRS